MILPQGLSINVVWIGGIHKCPFWDLMVVSWGHRKKKCIPMAEKWVVFERKNLRQTFHSSRRPFLSSIWTVQPRYARLDNRPISERKVRLSEWKVCLRFFRSQSTHFPAIGNTYSLERFSWKIGYLAKNSMVEVRVFLAFWTCLMVRIKNSWHLSKHNFFAR